MTALTLCGAEVLLPDGLHHADIAIAEGQIQAAPGARSVDLTGCLVLPGIVDIHGDGFERHMAPRRGALREADGMIHSVKGLMGGEPVFKDTRIPVRAIATMRNQGASVEELLEGYPSLSARMIELAEIWTAAHPARGRPKTLSEQGFLAKSTRTLPLKAGSNPKSAGTIS